MILTPPIRPIPLESHTLATQGHHTNISSSQTIQTLDLGPDGDVFVRLNPFGEPIC